MNFMRLLLNFTKILILNNKKNKNMKTLQQILEAKLNSLTSDKFENLSDTLFNSENRYEPAYFRKFLESEEIAVKDIKKELEKYYIHYEMSDKTLKLIKDKAKKIILKM